ncbi:MAG: ferredoxin family protein [Myxococcales bacterium]|nr:MAG: ferredoxin family protein [Myxococcales bacterium]
MIEVVSKDRCTGCNLCVRVCPTNVFEENEGEAPTIARQEDCQTCFQCEVYCPFDALFVAPLRHPAPEDSEWRSEQKLIETGQLGLYRRRVGWSDEERPAVPSDAEWSVLLRAMQGGPPAAR